MSPATHSGREDGEPLPASASASVPTVDSSAGAADSRTSSTSPTSATSPTSSTSPASSASSSTCSTDNIAAVPPRPSSILPRPPPSAPPPLPPPPLCCCACVELHPGVVRRVKVYALDASDVWQDRGTGQAQLHQQCPQCSSGASAPSTPSFALSLASPSPAGEGGGADSPSSAASATPSQRPSSPPPPAPPAAVSRPSLLLVVWPETSDASALLSSRPAPSASAALTSASTTPPPSSASAAAVAAPLLCHRVEPSVAYSLQADTILSWTEPGDGAEWALSFQDTHRCQEVLQEVSAHQQLQQHQPHCSPVTVAELGGAMEERRCQPAQRQPSPRRLRLRSTQSVRPTQPMQSMREGEEREEQEEDEEGGGGGERRGGGGCAGSEALADALTSSAESAAVQGAAAAASRQSLDLSPSSLGSSPIGAGDGAGDDDGEEWTTGSTVFPLPSSMSVLPSLQSRLIECGMDSALRQSILSLIASPASPWLSSLFELTRRCEEAGELDSLQRLFSLLVSLINALHDEALVELLFHSSLALFTFISLEYDPAIVARLSSTGQLRLPLRRHMDAMRAARCHWVLPPAATSSSAEDEDDDGSAAVERRLHFYHRLSYAKDVVLLAHLDDAAAATFTSLTYTYRMHIVTLVHHHTAIVHRLTRQMHAHMRTHSSDPDGGLAAATLSPPSVARSPPRPSLPPSPPQRSGGRHQQQPLMMRCSASLICRCPPHRLLHLDDGEGEGEGDKAVTASSSRQTMRDEAALQRLPAATVSGGDRSLSSPSLALALLSLLRRRLLLVSSLLSLSTAVQPHLRSSFAESWMEHGVIDIVSQALSVEAESACAIHDRADRAVGVEVQAALRASIRCVRRLFPLSLAVLCSLLSHCPDGFRSAFVEHRSFLLTALIRVLALPRHLDAAIAHQSLAFIRALVEGDDEELGGGGGGGAVAGAGTSLARSMLRGEMGQLMADTLRRLAGHRRPHSVRLSSLALLEWLTCAISRLPSSDVESFCSQQRLAQLLSAFLTPQVATSPRPCSPPPPPSSSPSERPLPSVVQSLHPAEVLCGVVRLLSALLSLHSTSLLSALIAAAVFSSLLRLLCSPLLRRPNLIHSAILGLFTAIAQQQQQLLAPHHHSAALVRHISAQVQAMRSTAGTDLSLLSPFAEMRSRVEELDDERSGEGVDEGEEVEGDGRGGGGGGGSRRRPAEGRQQRKLRQAPSISLSPALLSPSPSSATSNLFSGGTGHSRLMRRVVDDAYFDEDDEDGGEERTEEAERPRQRQRQREVEVAAEEQRRSGEKQRSVDDADERLQSDEAAAAVSSSSMAEWVRVEAAARERRQRERAAEEDAMDLRHRIRSRRSQLHPPTAGEAATPTSAGLAPPPPSPSPCLSPFSLAAPPLSPLSLAVPSSPSPSPPSLFIRFRASARREAAIVSASPALAAAKHHQHLQQPPPAESPALQPPHPPTLSLIADTPPSSPPSSSRALPSSHPPRPLSLALPPVAFSSPPSSSSSAVLSLRPRSPIPPEFVHIDEYEGLHLHSSGDLARINSNHSHTASSRLLSSPAPHAPPAPPAPPAPFSSSPSSRCLSSSSKPPSPCLNERRRASKGIDAAEVEQAEHRLLDSTELTRRTGAQRPGEAVEEDSEETERSGAGAGRSCDDWSPHPSDAHTRAHQVPG